MADLKELHSFFEEYLQRKGVNINTAFRCFSPEHEDKHPSMLFSKKAKKCTCLACGEKMDIFKFVGLEYNLPTFKERLEKVLYLKNNLDKIEDINKTIYSKKNTEVILEQKKESEAIKKKEYPKLAYYFKDCKNKISETDYLQKRGISKRVCDLYNIGYDPKFKNGTWKAIIIPTSFYSFTARNTDNLSQDRLRKVGHLEVFNYWEISQNKKEPFFIVEGEIDALSFAEIGKKAISLGSVANLNHFIKKIEEDKPKNMFYLCLDNDAAGHKAEELLFQKMKALGMNVEKVNLLGVYKDPNDFLLNDRESFIEKTNEICNELENPFIKKNIKDLDLGR